ncbi:hypothetical protein M758_3G264000 [Ceratodon purpureus]|uniref:Uncharacterized protein n=1 Tax=Ceratodon purpureus TaxID=3225 RepID=A0A8T0IQ76_CERPU|nr:hypothetical protein KC19_3G263300 [Ceratodon purpureus]KAG0624649.1 hypothetical protein M758_3G264000 [Ceratodon purpureus]
MIKSFLYSTNRFENHSPPSWNIIHQNEMKMIKLIIHQSNTPQNRNTSQSSALPAPPHAQPSTIEMEWLFWSLLRANMPSHFHHHMRLIKSLSAEMIMRLLNHQQRHCVVVTTSIR